MKRTSPYCRRNVCSSAFFLTCLGLVVTGIATMAEAQGTAAVDATSQAGASTTPAAAPPAAAPASDAVKLKSSVDSLQANADVELSGNTDLLQSAQQLGQIASGVLEQQRTQKLANVVPLAAGAIGKFLKTNDSKALGIAGAASIFSTLFAEPRDVGEVYSINSGNRFQVTPIFDPSGQALRFKFDFVGSTRVTEPNGTTSRQIPRVIPSTQRCSSAIWKSERSRGLKTTPRWERLCSVSAAFPS